MGDARPNYFIAIQVTDKKILAKAQKIQNAVTRQSLQASGKEMKEFLHEAIMPVEKMHFTVNVMHLKGHRELKSAKTILNDVGSEIRQDFLDNPMVFTVKGLGNFGSKVWFAEIMEQEVISRLTKLHHIFNRKFHEKLHLPLSTRAFQAHLTLANIARSRNLIKNGVESFPSSMWAKHEQAYFGKQHVTTIQLLEMGSDPSTGYYKIHGEFHF